MATERTRELTRSIPSTQARYHALRPLNPQQKAAVLATPAGQRQVLHIYASADGRSRYAYDGIQIRRIP